MSGSQSGGLCEVEVSLTFLVISPPPSTTAGHTTVFLEQASPVKNALGMNQVQTHGALRMH